MIILIILRKDRLILDKKKWRIISDLVKAPRQIQKNKKKIAFLAMKRRRKSLDELTPTLRRKIPPSFFVGCFFKVNITLKSEHLKGIPSQLYRMIKIMIT